jgi:hypothetical protein
MRPKVNPHQLKVFEEGTTSPRQTSLKTPTTKVTKMMKNTSQFPTTTSTCRLRMVSFTEAPRSQSRLMMRKKLSPSIRNDFLS